MKHRKERLNLDGEWLRMPQAQAYANVGRGVLDKLIKSGKLPATKIGDAPRSPVVVSKRDIDECLARMRMRMPRTAETEAEAA